MSNRELSLIKYELSTPKIHDDLFDEVYDEATKEEHSFLYMNLAKQKFYQNFEYELTTEEEKSPPNSDVSHTDTGIKNEKVEPTEQEHEALIEEEIERVKAFKDASYEAQAPCAPRIVITLKTVMIRKRDGIFKHYRKLLYKIYSISDKHYWKWN